MAEETRREAADCRFDGGAKRDRTADLLVANSEGEVTPKDTA
jgi:hypothetical protein